MSSLAEWLTSLRLRNGLLAGCLAVLVFLGIDYGLIVFGMEPLRTPQFRLISAVVVGLTTAIVFALLATRERR